MEKPILFYDPISEPSRAVQWFALEGRRPLEIRYTGSRAQRHRSPEFAR